MALDGIFLHHLQNEISQRAVDARVDKIYQPSRDELIVTLRTRGDRFHLLLSARVNSARAHFTRCLPENPSKAFDRRPVIVGGTAGTGTSAAVCL